MERKREVEQCTKQYLRRINGNAVISDLLNSRERVSALCVRDCVFLAPLIGYYIHNSVWISFLVFYSLCLFRLRCLSILFRELLLLLPLLSSSLLPWPRPLSTLLLLLLLFAVHISHPTQIDRNNNRNRNNEQKNIYKNHELIDGEKQTIQWNRMS